MPFFGTTQKSCPLNGLKSDLAIFSAYLAQVPTWCIMPSSLLPSTVVGTFLTLLVPQLALFKQIPSFAVRNKLSPKTILPRWIVIIRVTSKLPDSMWEMADTSWTCRIASDNDEDFKTRCGNFEMLQNLHLPDCAMHPELFLALSPTDDENSF